jgi:hypothetical protein
MIKASTAMVLPLVLAGCVSYHIKDDGTARATIGETVKVGGLAVTPKELLEDSRCPEGTQCVWAGQVRIKAMVAYGSAGEMREMTLGKTVPVADGQLQLVEVMPLRKAGITLYPEDYRFGFRFAGGL